MNNLASHKVTGGRDSIEATSAQLLYLPLYLTPSKRYLPSLRPPCAVLSNDPSRFHGKN
jgi:hypothetical protein